MNQAKIALACHDAKGVVAGMEGPFEVVAVAAMRAARANWTAPSEDEAFVAALGALEGAYPDLPILAEARAIGDRSKVLAALVDGVPVDMEAALARIAPFPDAPLDLLGLWERSAREEP